VNKIVTNPDVPAIQDPATQSTRPYFALRAVIYNGNAQPGGSRWRHGDHVPPSETPALVAAFNGGFRLDMARGGYQSEGRVVRPFVTGRATFGVRADGTVDLGVWGRDLQPTTPYASAFQSLDLIVDGANDVAGLSRDDHLRWGQTLGGRGFVWRSGVGIDASRQPRLRRGRSRRREPRRRPSCV
jgi:hypothetical protein